MTAPWGCALGQIVRQASELARKGKETKKEKEEEVYMCQSCRKKRKWHFLWPTMYTAVSQGILSRLTAVYTVGHKDVYD